MPTRGTLNNAHSCHHLGGLNHMAAHCARCLTLRGDDIVLLLVLLLLQLLYEPRTGILLLHLAGGAWGQWRAISVLVVIAC